MLIMQDKDARFKKSKRVLEPVELSRTELITMTEAAEILGYASIYGVKSHINLGNLDEIIDTSVGRGNGHGRSLVVCKQVIELGERLGRDINMTAAQVTA